MIQKKSSILKKFVGGLLAIVSQIKKVPTIFTTLTYALLWIQTKCFVQIFRSFLLFVKSLRLDCVRILFVKRQSFRNFLFKFILLFTVLSTISIFAIRICVFIHSLLLFSEWIEISFFYFVSFFSRTLIRMKCSNFTVTVSSIYKLAHTVCVLFSLWFVSLFFFSLWCVCNVCMCSQNSLVRGQWIPAAPIFLPHVLWTLCFFVMYSDG